MELYGAGANFWNMLGVHSVLLKAVMKISFIPRVPLTSRKQRGAQLHSPKHSALTIQIYGYLSCGSYLIYFLINDAISDLATKRNQNEPD